MGVGACSGVSFTFSCTLSIEEHVTYYFTAQQIPSGLGVIANTHFPSSTATNSEHLLLVSVRNAFSIAVTCCIEILTDLLHPHLLLHSRVR